MLICRFLLLLFLTAGATAASSAPQLSANQQVAADVFLVKMGKGDFSSVDRLYGEGFRAHSGGKSFSLDEDNMSGRAIRTAAPDLAVEVQRIAGDGELVAVHWRATGTNSVAAAGMPGRGKRFDVEGMTFFRFRDGRIVEEWSLTDRLALMQQLSASD